MIRPAVTAMLALLSLGCGQPLPDPVVRSVEPSSFEEGQAPMLRVAFEAVFPFSVDYGREATPVQQEVTLKLGELPLVVSAPPVAGEVLAPVPFGVDPGAWDLTLTLADGRTGTLAGAVTVTPGEFPASYLIDPIGEQKRGESFEITIRGEGGFAPNFDGTVRLSVNRGSISPEITGPFTGGVRTETVTLTAVGSGLVISVEDAAGTQASSEPFKVSP